jgi:hypothetical protein
LIITRASNLRHFKSKLLHAGTLLFDRNNHDGITDALTSNARCRVTIHSSPDYQKLSTVLPKTRRCCRAVASTKASRCLSRRVSYSSYTSALPVTSEPSSSSLWEFATTTLADLPPSRLFGFLLGSTLAGGGVYYYILEEYKVSNELLTEDIYVRYCI